MQVIFSNNKELDDTLPDKSDTINAYSKESFVDIRVQEVRNKKKTKGGKKTRLVTIIEGLADDLDLQKMIKYMRRQFSRTGYVKVDRNGKEVLQMLGDIRQELADWLLVHHICKKEEIVMHGSKTQFEM